MQRRARFTRRACQHRADGSGWSATAPFGSSVELQTGTLFPGKASAARPHRRLKRSARRWSRTVARRATSPRSRPLKFFEPIRGWFEIQIQQSHLPRESILPRKLGGDGRRVPARIAVASKFANRKSRGQLVLLACLMLVAQMCVAIYVHL